MTVHELIVELNKIPNKNKTIYISYDNHLGMSKLYTIEEECDKIYLTDYESIYNDLRKCDYK